MNQSTVTKSWTLSIDQFQKMTKFQKFAYVIQSVACFSLVLMAICIFCVKDPKRRVTGHPSTVVAQICLVQATLYYFMITADIPTTCMFMDYTIIEQMTSWIPIKTPLTYYMSDENSPTVTFRMIWFTTHEMIGFMGLFSILLQFFFLLDMIFTWRHPVKYLSS